MLIVFFFKKEVRSTRTPFVFLLAAEVSEVWLSQGLRLSFVEWVILNSFYVLQFGS